MLDFFIYFHLENKIMVRKAYMQIHKSFLATTVVLLLSFSEQGLAMEDDLPESYSASRPGSPSEMPIEIQAHILSFLDQRDLLRAGGTSKRWRQAAERVWKNKPLDLSNRCLRQEDYKALSHGPFYSLILTSVQLGAEGAKALATGNFTGLTELDLGRNRIGDEGAKWLASGNLFALTALDLDANRIGDEGKEVLAKNVRLKVFY